MTGKLLPLIALLALAACQPSGEPEEPAATATATAAPATAPTPTPRETADRIVSPKRLAGEYRVAGVGGKGIDLPYGITVSITLDTIHLTADCVNVEWGYVMESGRLSTLRVPTEGCARGLNDVEEALVEAFDGAQQVSLNPANGYEFTGRGPSATLFTQ